MALPSMVLLSVLNLHGAVKADEVVVTVNDTRLITIPPNLWNLSDPTSYESICGGERWLGSAGQSVSLNFTGTGVTVNFFGLASGRRAQVAVDSTYVNQLDLYVPNVFSTDCNVVPWTSDVLALEQHTVSVTALDLNPAITDGYVNIHNFVYESPSTNSSGGTSSIGHMSTKSTTVAWCVAGVMGLILIVIAVFLLCRRRQWRSLGCRWFDLKNPSMNPTVTPQLDLSEPDPTMVHVPAVQHYIQTDITPTAPTFTQPATRKEIITSSAVQIPPRIRSLPPVPRLPGENVEEGESVTSGLQVRAQAHTEEDIPPEYTTREGK